MQWKEYMQKYPAIKLDILIKLSCKFIKWLNDQMNVQGVKMIKSYWV
jgi:hypothetical protein